ncbi:MAG: Bacterial extracellular solute-binding protein [bacterium ADurb.Bin478]|nr:MAG: Bacterial extracellular solute-binding protein [bacterium ADurb.Bin478]
MPLNDYLELPNKYTPEDTTPWKMTFKSPFQTTFSSKGQWGAIPLDLVSTGVYINVDLFNSVGIDVKNEIVPELGSPKDWATLIEWCKKIKDAGYFAFSMSGYILEWWLQGVLGDQLFWNLIPDFDKLNYHELTPKMFQEGLISQEEVFMQYLCNDAKMFELEGTRTMFEIFKDLSQYMPDGFVSADTMWSAAWDLYLQGQLAMFWDGSWRVGSIMQDDRRKFEFSSFWLPPLTKDTTPLAKDPPILPIGVGGYGSLAYAIHRKCIAEGKVDACIDWLMYITTPERDETIVNEVPSFIPANKKSKSLPEVENLFVGETRLIAGAGHYWPVPMNWFSGEESKYTDTFKREMTLYLLGEQDLDKFMANADAAFVGAGISAVPVFVLSRFSCPRDCRYLSRQTNPL